MLKWEYFRTAPRNMPLDCLWTSPRTRSLSFLDQSSTNFPERYKPASLIGSTQQNFLRHSLSREFYVPVSLHQEPLLPQGNHLSKTNELAPKDASEELLLLQSNELKSLLADSERTKILRKLSEANQYNRFLKRQLQMKDDTLVDFKSELTVLEHEIQALVGLAEELANSTMQLNSKKINGKYISSHLLSRLEAVHEKVKEQMKGFDSQRVEEITLLWVGMAESVQVMGSFDGWSRGEEMSPEYSSSYTSFSATLKLRPGQYEIKFLVDGEWQLSPDLATVGDGPLKNNVLVVE